MDFSLYEVLLSCFITETASSEYLSPKDQELISQDQKHTSNVAKVHYRKKNSRAVAQKTSACIEKLINNVSKESQENENESNQIDEVTIEDEITTIDGEENRNIPEAPVNKPITRLSAKQQNKATFKINEPIVVSPSSIRQKKNSFTKEEDMFIVNGLKKYGKGKWTQILNDPDFKIHPSRKISTLMTRAKKQKLI